MINDIQPAHLTIPDSVSAFEGGAVDALPIADPYLAQAELANKVKVLVRVNEVAPQRAFYIATRNFVDKQLALLKVILEEQRRVEEWAKANSQEVAKLLAKQIKYNPKVWEISLAKRPYFGVYQVPFAFTGSLQQVTLDLKS